MLVTTIDFTAGDILSCDIRVRCFQTKGNWKSGWLFEGIILEPVLIPGKKQKDPTFIDKFIKLLK
jgi:hypothetical protein